MPVGVVGNYDPKKANPAYRRSDIDVHKSLNHSHLPAAVHSLISKHHAKQAAAHLHKGDEHGFKRHMEVAHYHHGLSTAKRKTGDTSTRGEHGDWFKSLSAQAQQQYRHDHPGTDK